MLQNLLSRAQAAEAAEMASANDFTFVSHDIEGAMTDACKRGPDDGLFASPPKRVYKTADGEPSPSEVVFGKTPKGKPVTLPDGVASLTEWGQTVIQFGKFAPKKKNDPTISYEELRNQNTDESRGYISYALRYVDGSESLLHDLALYLYAVQLQSEDRSQKPVIPGTSTIRRFKKDT